MARWAALAVAVAAAGAVLPARAPGEGASAAAPARASWDGEARARAWLTSCQDPDGAFRSTTYGLLRSGQSLTAFAVAALRGGTAGLPHGDVARALAFLRAHTDAEGAVGRSDPSSEDYPTYATALAVCAFSDDPAAAGDVARWAGWLRSRQFAEGNGWSPTDPAYGGFGIGGPVRRPPHAGHVDLSMTRHALEALRAACGGADPDAATAAVFARAAVFLGRCQTDDGGARFSPVVDEANKAGRDARGHRPYGTATADLVLAWLACGVSPDAPRVLDACRWLAAHHRTNRVPGCDDLPPPDWGTAMRHYYLAAAARVFAACGGPDGWRAGIRAALRTTQRADGAHVNGSPMMKEDDPLVATGLAVIAWRAAGGG